MRTDRSSDSRSQPLEGTVPRLVAISPPELQGAAFELTADHVVVGRGETSSVRVDNQTLSRTHAAIDRSTGQTVIADLQSTNGTYVNGSRVLEGTRPLSHGDLLRLGEIELRYEDASLADATRQVPVSSPASGRQKSEYHIGHQQAEQLNNVGRDQYNEYAYYQYVQQRESFARDIAATKTKARRLIWIGFALFVIGLGVYFTMFVSGFKVLSSPDIEDPSSFEEFWGPKVGGVPVGIFGFGLALIGGLLVLVGIVLHIVAAARRRQFEGSNPPPPPPWVSGPSARWSA